MTFGSEGGAAGAAAGTAAAAHYARMNAIKASGVLVRLEPEEFERLLLQIDAPLIVMARGGFFRRHVSYLVAHRGLAFHCRTEYELSLPKSAQLVLAKRISIPA